MEMASFNTMLGGNMTNNNTNNTNTTNNTKCPSACVDCDNITGICRACS